MYQRTDDELGYFIYMSQLEQAEAERPQADEDIDLISEAQN